MTCGYDRMVKSIISMRFEDEIYKTAIYIDFCILFTINALPAVVFFGG